MIGERFQSSALPADWQPNYDRQPAVAVPDSDGAASAGWDDIAERLTVALDHVGPKAGGPTLCIDCYDGVDVDAIIAALTERLTPNRIVDTRTLFKSPDELNAMLEPWLGGDDPIFGFLNPVTLDAFFDTAKIDAAQRELASASASADPGSSASSASPASARGCTLVIGPGATRVTTGDVMVLADLPRWEIQARQRAGRSGNLGANNTGAPTGTLYKRGYFVDWRALDRHKKPLLGACDFLLDTTEPAQPKLVAGDALRAGLKHVTSRPFRVVPFFDPGPWGGQWMRAVCDLHDYRDDDPPNYAWCFDCVPEENAIRLTFGEVTVELPSVDVLYRHPVALLGDPVHARFGDEFPIRFDFLDTMGGGNLSFQVHPRTEFIQQHFGMHYTQDESYYLLDAAPDGTCYLGVTPDADPASFRAALEEAQAGRASFDDERFANVWPARPHDHFLIPAGTVHCSGRNTMVLEISATPYIFTFKLWDWGRLGLDGKPRPINIDRGMPNIQWERDTAYCRRELINDVQPLGEGDGWRAECTGLHRRQFIETHRHWFTRPVEHDTGGTERGGVNVLNLVQGRAAMIESPDARFAPFEVHYAETFIVPAAVGRYTIRPLGDGEHATIKAFVRTGLEMPNV